MARSQRAISNSAAADARASDRMAGKSQTPTAASKARSTTSDVPAETPTAASKARSTASDVPAEAPAPAAPTDWTGFRNRGNCEEQDRGGGKASNQVSLGGRGHFQCRCARRRHEELIVVFLRIESARRRHEQNADMAHGPPPKLNSLCRSVSLSVHCDKRKEKERLFIGAGSSGGGVELASARNCCC
jgi:hypothetical protein